MEPLNGAEYLAPKMWPNSKIFSLVYFFAGQNHSNIRCMAVFWVCFIACFSNLVQQISISASEFIV